MEICIFFYFDCFGNLAATSVVQSHKDTVWPENFIQRKKFVHVYSTQNVITTKSLQ